MEERIGKYVCIEMDSDGRWDLYRDIHNLKETVLFDSADEAEKQAQSEGSNKFMVLKIERDTI